VAKERMGGAPWALLNELRSSLNTKNLLHSCVNVNSRYGNLNLNP
jgi:hypothetical protein